MADKQNTDTDTEATRKRKEISSISDLDTSGTTPQPQAESKKPKKKKKKDKNSNGKETAVRVDSEEQTDKADEKQKEMKTMACTEDITRHLSDINKKLSNVITKDDGFLRQLIKEVFTQMKEEFLLSVTKRIEILEGRLFEKDEENDKLKHESDQLKKEADSLRIDLTGYKRELAEQKSENAKLKNQIADLQESVKLTTEVKMNELEQYSRRNNIRINGIEEADREDAEITTTKVIDTLNRKIENLNLQYQDIDISHRIGNKRKDKDRQIIVKFNSRLQRDKVLKNRKSLKSSNIYVNEDLTKINQHVLACIRKKMPDEVDQSWSRNGRLFYRPKSDTNSVIEVQYKDFQTWLDLPWPTKVGDKY